MRTICGQRSEIEFYAHWHDLPEWGYSDLSLGTYRMISLPCLVDRSISIWNVVVLCVRWWCNDEPSRFCSDYSVECREESKRIRMFGFLFALTVMRDFTCKHTHAQAHSLVSRTPIEPSGTHVFNAQMWNDMKYLILWCLHCTQFIFRVVFGTHRARLSFCLPTKCQKPSTLRGGPTEVYRQMTMSGAVKRGKNNSTTTKMKKTKKNQTK